MSARFIVPILGAWGAPVKGAAVLDVGCAEGGGMRALYNEGGYCVGIDIDESRVQTALSLEGPRDIDSAGGNLYTDGKAPHIVSEDSRWE